jgi:hypothetical protein
MDYVHVPAEYKYVHFGMETLPMDYVDVLAEYKYVHFGMETLFNS